MQMDLLNFGTEETAARFTFGYEECLRLMQACGSLRDQKFPGVTEKLPRMFNDSDLAKVVDSPEQAEELVGLFELEQAFHQALHMFPQGHEH